MRTGGRIVDVTRPQSKSRRITWLCIAINVMIFQHEVSCTLPVAARHCSYGCGLGASVSFGGGMHRRVGASLGTELRDQFGIVAHVPGQSGPFGRRLFLDQRV